MSLEHNQLSKMIADYLGVPTQTPCPQWTAFFDAHTQTTWTTEQYHAVGEWLLRVAAVRAGTADSAVVPEAPPEIAQLLDAWNKYEGFPTQTEQSAKTWTRHPETTQTLLKNATNTVLLVEEFASWSDAEMMAAEQWATQCAMTNEDALPVPPQVVYDRLEKTYAARRDWLVSSSSTEVVTQVQDVLYRIVEEVPGLPETDAFYIDGPRFASHDPKPHFSTCEAAEKFLTEHGCVPFLVERFEP